MYLKRNNTKLVGYSPFLKKAITAINAQTTIMATTNIVIILYSSFVSYVKSQLNEHSFNLSSGNNFVPALHLIALYRPNRLRQSG